jgi:steroid delta-isomerase
MTRSHERYRQYLETLTPTKLERLGDYVTEDVRFRDPFNDVTGEEAMRRIFQHMFEAVGPVTFRVSRMATDADHCLMSWRFEAILRGRPWAFDGMSEVRFGADGRVVEHIDYWDAASAFYERLPLIGPPLKWLRGRLAVR